MSDEEHCFLGADCSSAADAQAARVNTSTMLRMRADALPLAMLRQ